MILREFLYVDTDKVRGMQAQLDGGISEEERHTTKADKRSEVGAKGFVNHYQGTGEEQYVHKSLGDALFPRLEQTLEAEGVLNDISEELQDSDYWTSQELRKSLPPGTLVRITSMGSLFDARYVATTFSNFGATYSGMAEIGALPANLAPPKPASGKQKPRHKVSSESGTSQELEDLIKDFGPIVGDDGSKVGAEYLRGIVKISRGLFMPGLHLNLTPTQSDLLTVGARLQEGRQFLDSDAEILFSRYGVGQQEWTLVGTVGYFAQPTDRTPPPPSSIADANGNVVRGKASSYINHFLGYLGALGFADRIPYPGFSIVPLAVYRSILRTTSKAISIP